MCHFSSGATRGIAKEYLAPLIYLYPTIIVLVKYHEIQKKYVNLKCVIYHYLLLIMKLKVARFL